MAGFILVIFIMSILFLINFILIGGLFYLVFQERKHRKILSYFLSALIDGYYEKKAFGWMVREELNSRHKFNRPLFFNSNGLREDDFESYTKEKLADREKLYDLVIDEFYQLVFEKMGADLGDINAKRLLLSDNSFKSDSAKLNDFSEIYKDFRRRLDRYNLDPKRLEII
jgi:hypothetical protein